MSVAQKVPEATAVAQQPPPGMILYQLAIGHFASQALDVALKLGLADLLADGPRDAEDLAQAAGCNAGALARMMRLLASHGVFEELPSGKFALTPMGELLRADVPGSMQALVTLFAGYSQVGWRELEYCVRTGNPAFRRTNPDANCFDQLSQDQAVAAMFDRAMATFAPQTSAAVAAAYDFSAFGTVADIGGGNGSLLMGILQANPALRGIVFDQPDVADRATLHIAAAGMADRCQVASGSFFDSVVPGADAYLLKHVIHDWNDHDATRILKTCLAAMPPHAKLLIVEGVYPPRIDQSPESRGATATDVNMLVATGGRQRNEGEFRNLLAGAGFKLTRIVPTAARASVIEAERA